MIPDGEMGELGDLGDLSEEELAAMFEVDTSNNIPATYSDVAYASLSDSEVCNIYLPNDDTSGSYPVIVLVHGGGFAGTVQAFVKKEKAAAYAAAMDAVFGEGACQIVRIRPCGGIRLL